MAEFEECSKKIVFCEQMKRQLPIIFIVYGSILLIASMLPSYGEINITKIEPLAELRLDYFIHFCAYVGFYILLLNGSISHKTAFAPSSFRKTFIITLLLATGTEIIQLILSYRVFNLFDLLSNLSGIAFGTVIFWLYQFLSKTIPKMKMNEKKS